MDTLLLSLHDVCKVTTLSRSVVYDLIRAGLFPESVAIPGTRRVAWRTSDIQNWVDELRPSDDTASSLQERQSTRKELKLNKASFRTEKGGASYGHAR